MKAFILYLNRDLVWGDSLMPLTGWGRKQYGIAVFDELRRKHVCRIPEADWNQEMEDDILKLSHLRGNVWLRGIEFECEDGKRFDKLADALRHEDSLKVIRPVASETSIAITSAATAPSTIEPEATPSGLAITKEMVERANSTNLRVLAKQANMPDYRKYPKSDDLRPRLLDFLGFSTLAQPAQTAEAV